MVCKSMQISAVVKIGSVHVRVSNKTVRLEAILQCQTLVTMYKVFIVTSSRFVICPFSVSNEDHKN